jgi:hypothetical protein
LKEKKMLTVIKLGAGFIEALAIEAVQHAKALLILRTRGGGEGEGKSPTVSIVK